MEEDSVCREIPTPDEWLKYVVKKLRDDGREELLQLINTDF